MTQYERMVKYDPGDKEILKEQVPFQNKLFRFNKLKPSQYRKKKIYEEGFCRMRRKLLY